MRPRKPTAQKNDRPLGNQLRDALARKRADDAAQEQQQKAQAQSEIQRNLSSWFNDVAVKLPEQIQALTRALNSGQSASADFSYSASDAGFSLRGAGEVQLEQLAGFRKLDETCKELDVECTVTSGRNGYGRKVGAGEPYIHINVDAEKPYQPLAAEKVAPRRHNRFR